MHRTNVLLRSPSGRSSPSSARSPCEPMEMMMTSASCAARRSVVSAMDGGSSSRSFFRVCRKRCIRAEPARP